MEKHFGNLIHEAVVEKPETIGEYTPKVPLKVEQEYVEFLKQLWDEVAPSNLKGTPLVLENKNCERLLLPTIENWLHTHIKMPPDARSGNASPRRTTRM